MKLSRITVPYNAFALSAKLIALTYFTVGSFPSNSELGYLTLPVIAFSLTFFTGIYSYVRWKRFEYFFDDENLKITKGIFRRSDRDIPLKRVQNVDVKRNFIHRLLGISTVSLETAGGSTTEASLKYVEFEKGQGIKQRIREIKHEDNEKHGDENSEESQELYHIDRKELFLLGFTGVDQRLIFGVLGLIGFSAPLMAPILDDSGIGLVTGISLVVVLALLVVVVSNFITNYARFFDFTLMRRSQTLEYRRGLLNRSEGSIPLRKLQRLVISDNPLKRFFDRSSLNVETAGYSRKDMESELAIPLAKEDRVRKLLNKIEELEDYSLKKIPVRTMRKYFSRYTLISILTVTVYYILTGNFYYISIPILLIASLLASFLKWKHIGYTELENHFVVRKGFWNRKEIIVPYDRTQNIIMSDTVLQRLWDLSSVTLDIAGTGIMSGDAKIIDIDNGEAWNLSKRLHKNFKKTRNTN